MNSPPSTATAKSSPAPNTPPKSAAAAPSPPNGSCCSKSTSPSSGTTSTVCEALGKRIGRAEKAAEIAARFRRLIRELEQNAPARRTRVYLELYSPCRSAGNESYAGDLLRLSGGENVVSSLQRSGTVSAEAIIHGDPEVIFVVDGFTSPDELARRSGWGEISAVRNRRVFTIDRKYLVPGYDPAGAIREMSLHLHSPRKQ